MKCVQRGCRCVKLMRVWPLLRDFPFTCVQARSPDSPVAVRPLNLSMWQNTSKRAERSRLESILYKLTLLDFQIEKKLKGRFFSHSQRGSIILGIYLCHLHWIIHYTISCSCIHKFDSFHMHKLIVLTIFCNDLRSWVCI